MEDNSIIDKLQNFRKEETKDWWDTISNEERESIDKGISEAKEGKLKSHSTVREIYEKWL